MGTSRSGNSLFITYSSTNHQDPFAHFAVGREPNDRQVGKPLLDVAGYGFRVHILLFVRQ